MMLTFRAGKVTLLVILLSLTAACSREQQDWRSTEAADTVEGYGQFLERHPDSELATQAHARVAQLSEDREWQRAGSADTADAYRQFLAQHPNGKWAQEARIRIQNFSLGGLPVAESSVSGSPLASTAGGSAAMASALAPSAGADATSGRALPGEAAVATSLPTQASPSSPLAPAGSAAVHAPYGATQVASSSSVQSTSYGVQLGAFSSESAATNQWQQLTGRFGTELRGLSPHVISADTATGHLFRLQAQVADESLARAICDSLKKQSQACVPVLPH